MGRVCFYANNTHRCLVDNLPHWKVSCCCFAFFWDRTWWSTLFHFAFLYNRPSVFLGRLITGVKMWFKPGHGLLTCFLSCGLTCSLPPIMLYRCVPAGAFVALGAISKWPVKTEAQIPLCYHAAGKHGRRLLASGFVWVKSDIHEACWMLLAVFWERSLCWVSDESCITWSCQGLFIG